MRRKPATLAGVDPRAVAATWAASDFITDREHVARSLARVPYRMHLPAVESWARRRARDGHVVANLEMLDLSEAFSGGVDYTASDDEMILAAEKHARNVRGYLADFRIAEQGAAVRSRLERYCRDAGVAPPVVKTLQGMTARLVDEKWWRRALRRSILRTLEGVAIRLGFVHRRAALYASHEAVDRRRGQRARNQRILESLEAENDAGERFTLAELSKRNVSNPAVRRAELMTRIAGFEKFAQGRGDVCLFVTWTCPSRMHARYAASGDPVENYDGTSPRAAQEYLSRQWAKARAMFKRRRCYVYGFRIVEPHHDGTPHWHLWLFCRPSMVDGAEAIMARYAKSEDAHELTSPAANKARFHVERMDPAKGTAAGYIAKYVAKNIDGYRVGVDYEARDVSGIAEEGGAGRAHGLDAAASRSEKTAERVETWARTWGIRQFQQIGGPGVTIWRELRRLNGPQQLPLFDPMREHADAGAWDAYVRAMGGIEIFKRDRTLQIWRVDYEKENRYGEPSPAAIEGVEHFFIEQCRTRMREWQIIGGGRHGQAGRIERPGQLTKPGADFGNDFRAASEGRGGAGGDSGVVRGARAHGEKRSDGPADTRRVAVRGGYGDAARGAVGVAAVAVDVPWTGVNNCTQLDKSEDCDAWIDSYERASARGDAPRIGGRSARADGGP